MTDRLKLSDPTGDAEVDKIAVAAEQEDRIQQLRKNIAALQSKLAKQTANAAPSPAPAANNKIGARKHGSFKAISTAPSINWTPHGPTMVPVPYPVVQDLSSSVNTARTVRFNGCPVYLLDASTQPKCTGDEQGTGKGIKSGTVSGEVKPVQGSSTVRVEGKQVVREGDACTMNGGNCPGIYVTTPATSGADPKEALATSNPPKHPGLQAAEARIKQWAHEMQDHLRNVLKQPVEAGIGAAKSYANTLPETLDMLLKAGMEQRATEQETAALTSSVFGQTTAAKVLMESAAATRQQGDKIDLPKFTMNNAGQKGGDAIASFAFLFAGISGGIKGIAKGGISKGLAKKISPKSGASSAKTLSSPGGGVRVSVGGVPLDMNAIRAKYAVEIDKVSTFETLGVEDVLIDSYLSTPSGRQYLEELAITDPTADSLKLFERAVEQISSGSTLPNLKSITFPLVKIVPQGQSVSRYSPFFTTMDELQSAKKSGKGLADRFGLPIKSEAQVYDIYQITPTSSAKVFVSKVAPTTELGGIVVRQGEAIQYVVPNRDKWSPPIHIGTIEN